MSDIVERVLCPKHKESTPSFVVYRNGSAKCYGCGYYESSYSPANIEPAQPKYVEDIEDSIAQIQMLPIKEIRGLHVHASKMGYYIVWPNHDYYKFRAYHPTSNSNKYKGPSGIKHPWLELRTGSEHCLVIEGEINALSVEKVKLPIDIICPGSANDFYSKSSIAQLTKLSAYKTITLIADKDAAGVTALIKLKSLLLPLGLTVNTHLMEKDANNVLCEHGKEKLEEIIKKAMGL